jgi:two-component system, NarL family, nitrate/nitrite response regulator NarL
MDSLTSPIRIMLVDDHSTVLWGLQQLIDAQKPKMEVVGTATNGTTAMRCIQQLRPDVILLDVDLGDSSALDILPELTALQCGAILLLTGVRDESILDRAILLGARGIVSKQVQPPLLLRAIEAIYSGEFWLGRDAAGRIVHKRHSIDRQQQAAQEKLARLTPKEREVIRAVAGHASLPNKILAGQLCMSEHTLRNHLAAIYQKLDVNNRVALYLFATGNRLAEGRTGPLVN